MPSKTDNFYQNSDIIIERMIEKTGFSQNMFAIQVLGIKGVNVIRAKKTGKIPERWFEIMRGKYGVEKETLCAPAYPKTIDCEITIPPMTPEPYERDIEKGGGVISPEVKAELMGMTSEIIDSDTIYTSAIVSNIRAFHHGIKEEEKMGSMEKNMERMVKMMEEIKEQNKILAERIGLVETEKKWAGNGA